MRWNRRCTRLLFAAFCLAAVVAHAAPSVPPDSKRSAEAEWQASERIEAIEKETKALGNHPWAGSYYEGDGLGANITLWIAPRAGFVFHWHGCLGLYDRNYGPVTTEDGRIQLQFTFPNERGKGFQGIAPEFVPVRWGDRHYLIPSDRMVKFCNAINSGDEPRSGVHGLFLLRKGDEKKPAGGAPDWPAEFRSRLLSHPVSAKILAVGKPRVLKSGTREVEVTLDAGAEAGVFPEMELRPTNAREFYTVEVTAVEPGRATGVVRLFDGDRPIKAGGRVSTRR